ncbi:pyridoxal phosphate-dependent aminotransferase [Microbulbifer thermotolerans]|uniref:Aminotransferase n=1 Tax=Microbulbifer thermotolerans TaxID=252514 RepID=A0A143HKB2_MICTH|nr:pyridoxal phosphate-dependent aminotransferase [Microbulbifer thermotolerans]AMX01927.1 aspartate aminotransferase [Microbulbifer thermotolerans]MCX2779164.1 pyridoxal phosphate-dependent aminotransferase [Microbulbifer thermotolerans]MCX2781733.1 pyridoxal phosphate-dependent aminotransferase [Microbulbifer thermotolerans]MCX2793605.1 pyridoxal phosphate-dependent aminotransferase [Microbulbifer thermotolerans]MCX2801525.1 pyridoxal phosphate-dependent aminotransferase [Microbulbifer therm
MNSLDFDFYESEDPLWNPALLTIPVPGIRKMVNLAATMDDVIHLSIGQPDAPAPPHVIQAAVDALEAGQTGYTMDAGLPELLEALAVYNNARYGRGISPENILVTTGATEAIYLALTAVSAPGREFIVPDPSFMLYAPLIRMNGGEVKYIPTRAENNHQLDPVEVIDAIGNKTHAIVLNSPSNPTGTVYPRETIEMIVQEAAYRGVYVISDEVYDHLVYDNREYASVLSCCSDLDHVMVISSFSKTFSMAGMRIGWMIASQGAIRKLRRYHMFTTTVANTPCQWAGVAALQGERGFIDRIVETYKQRRDRLVQLVEKTPYLEGYIPEGAFYLFPSLPDGVNGSNVALRLLRETGVCTIAGDTFGESCRSALRISYATSIDNIEKAFERIIPWMARQDFG